ncbi:MAG TPA: PQQ-dependent sugar dehydrogenase [Vicinamibacterales bacterium]|nr:PQQ-dependent sugar dehydrogenase [Vicinamibacterales bacterium]
MYVIRGAAAGLLVVAAALAQIAQTTSDPFPTPIPATDGVIRVSFTEFASIPDIDGQAARMMLLVDEPGTRRMFVNDMRGPLYSVSYDGKTVKPYLDINAAAWNVGVQSQGAERGFQSFAFHPQFNRRGARGFGKFYTVTDTTNTTATPDFVPGGGNKTHHTVLLEWTAKNPAADTYDGAAPRELLRIEQPFPNHNGGHLTFNPLAAERDADFGLLYMGFADGGSGGDPMKLAQNLSSPFGKILRLDPFGTNSANGKYGVPTSNPFVKHGNDKTLGEIYAYGVRNPQRFFWDSKTRQMFMADIGQGTVEEISPVTAGANLGWNVWEGSFKFVNGREVSLDNPRGDAKVTYPVVEYGQADPLLQSSSAATGGWVYRQNRIPQFKDLLIFGDNPSGEVFYVHADKLPNGGQDAIRRILFNDNGTAKTLLQLIQAKNAAQGKPPATRADLRFATGPDGQLLLLNKRDGTIRMLVGDGRPSLR